MQYICLHCIRAEMTYTRVAHPPQNSAPTSSHSRGCTMCSWENKTQREAETDRQQRITCSGKTNTSSNSFFPHFLYLFVCVMGSEVND